MTSDHSSEPPPPRPGDGGPGDLGPGNAGPGASTIQAVSVGGSDGSRTVVTLSDGVEVTLATDAYLALGLSREEPVSPELRARLVAAGERWAAREAALRLLSHRSRSRSELERRLRRKDHPAAVVARVADELEDRGYLDDDAFARAWIRDRLRLKPRGARALRSELRRKGVSAAVADRALDEVFAEEEVSDRELAMELARTWVRRQPARLGKALLSDGRTPEVEKARRRYMSFMGRRGLSGSVAWSALDRLREEATGD